MIAVAYQKSGQLKVFVQSWLNQTSDNWTLTVIHDGPDAEFDSIMAAFADQSSGRIRYRNTPVRLDDYGHSLRELGLRNVSGDYVLLTNADNYYVPRAVEFLTLAVAKQWFDVVVFDMVHSHNRPGGRDLPPYSFFETAYARLSIDIGAAIVRTELARLAGFRDKTHDGDGSYFEDVARVRAPSELTVLKVRHVLYVHN